MEWQILDESPANEWSHYHLMASIEDGDELFTLEAGWQQCLYMVTVRSDASDDAIVSLCIFADDDPSKFAHQLMRMTQTDTGTRLRTIDARLQDAFVMTSDLRRSVDW